MTLKEIASKLVDYCRTGREADALSELYATTAVSVEAQAMPGADSAEIQGVEGIRGKHDWWNANFEAHSSSLEGPYLHGDDRFAVYFIVDATDKSTNERFTMKEVAIYTVADGKIVREEFYYGAG